VFYPWFQPPFLGNFSQKGKKISRKKTQEAQKRVKFFAPLAANRF
jgi:hypothetical protein